MLLVGAGGFAYEEAAEICGVPAADIAKAIRLIRDGSVVQDNLDLASLRREKDDASEVREGFECGLVLRNFQDIKIGDIVESFEMREIPRS